MKKWNFLGREIDVIEDDDIAEVYANTKGWVLHVALRVADTDKSQWNARMHVDCYMTRCTTCTKAIWVDPISIPACHSALSICLICFMDEKNHDIMKHLLEARRSSSEGK